MSWIDGHLDLAYLAVLGRDLRQLLSDDQGGCITLPALRQAGVDLVFGTIFTQPDPDGEASGYGYPETSDLDAAEAAGRRQFDVYRALEDEGEITIVRCARDLEKDGPLPRVVLLMEGADPIRSPDDVGPWFEAGLRIVGMSWATGTRYAGGNHAGGPLTSLGRELVSAMDAVGMIHDVSHLSDAAYDGFMEVATGPIIASHSNCRALLPASERHLRDDQIRTIGERGGMVGLNLFSRFLRERGRATISDCVKHLDHLCAVHSGRAHVGLGSDMDGGFPPTELPTHLDGPGHLSALSEALRGRGWSDAEIRGFREENWLRFLRSTLP